MPPWFFSQPKGLKAPDHPEQQPTRHSPAQSLLHYETGAPPPSSRVDPKLKRIVRRPLRIWDYWKLGAVFAAKATEVTTDVLSHHIWGPRRRSWGIEMTILSSLFRNAGQHSALVDIGSIRSLMAIGGLVPLPSDALVSPVAFQVKRRNLPGILAEFDAVETGERELRGEWVVGRKTWQRMQTDWKAAGKSDSTTNHKYPNIGGSAPTDSLKGKERVILYIHGGAYYLSSAAAQRIITIPLAKYTDSRVFALDYRLAPETCFPGPLHDAVSAYLRLIDELRIPPENILVCGDSAGGGLSLALLMYLRDHDFPLPSGAILMSPWVDLTMSCESWESNAAFDVVPFPTADNHMNPIALYLGEHTERYLTHPYASPLFGNFKGLPPLLVQAGDAEVLRDEIALLAHKATLAGVQVSHELYEDAIHVFQAFPFLEASRRSYESMRNFVRFVLPELQTSPPQPLGSIAEKTMEKEMETDRSVVVGGDGVENVTSTEKMQQFAQTNKAFKLDGVLLNSDTDSDSDECHSWVRSPHQHVFSVLEKKETFDIEHIEHVELDDIPELSLSSSASSFSSSSSSLSQSPPIHQSVSLPPVDSRPPFLARHSASSPMSESPNSSPSASPTYTRSPRRIRSTSSLLPVFSFDFQHNRHEKHNSPHLRNSSGPDNMQHYQQSFDINLFATSPPTTAKKHINAKHVPTHPVHAPTSMLPTPTMRKRRMSAGLTMSKGTHSGLSDLDMKKIIADYGESSSDPGYVVGDVESLVDEWTRYGPSNKTVIVSALPSALQ